MRGGKGGGVTPPAHLSPEVSMVLCAFLGDRITEAQCSRAIEFLASERVDPAPWED